MKCLHDIHKRRRKQCEEGIREKEERKGKRKGIKENE
jgi:hypothetical protein